MSLLFEAVGGFIGLVGGFALGRFTPKRAASASSELNPILACGVALDGKYGVSETMRRTLEAGIADSGASQGAIWTFKPDPGGTGEYAVACSTSDEIPAGLSAIAEQVLAGGQACRVTDDSLRQELLAVPIAAHSGDEVADGRPDSTHGVLAVVRARESSDDLALDRLQAYGAILGTILANRRMKEFQSTTLVATLEGVSALLEARDPFSAGRSLRVSMISQLLGQRLGLDADTLEELRQGATLHDIGKIAIPDSVLNKKGPLTQDEFELMKTHVIVGYEICQQLNFSEGVLLIVRNHHEKLDGSGYPDGLRSGELTLPLRIVCVADAFDAMSTARAFRRELSGDAVLEELNRHTGTQFDPIVVSTLREIIDNGELMHLYGTPQPESHLRLEAA